MKKTFINLLSGLHSNVIYSIQGSFLSLVKTINFYTNTKHVALLALKTNTPFNHFSIDNNILQETWNSPLTTGCGACVGGVIIGDNVVPMPGTKVGCPGFGVGLNGGFGVGAKILHDGTLQHWSFLSCTKTQYDGICGYLGHLK